MRNVLIAIALVIPIVFTQILPNGLSNNNCCPQLCLPPLLSCGCQPGCNVFPQLPLPLFPFFQRPFGLSMNTYQSNYQTPSTYQTGSGFTENNHQSQYHYGGYSNNGDTSSPYQQQQQQQQQQIDGDRGYAMPPNNQQPDLMSGNQFGQSSSGQSVIGNSGYSSQPSVATQGSNYYNQPNGIETSGYNTGPRDTIYTIPHSSANLGLVEPPQVPLLGPETEGTNRRQNNTTAAAGAIAPVDELDAYGKTSAMSGYRQKLLRMQ